MKHFLYLIIPVYLFLACGSGQTKAKETQAARVVSAAPAFNADSAYFYTEKQSLFGPRVPNTPAHVACGDYLANKLRSFGATVYEQKADLKSYDGTLLKARNIIGEFNPEKSNRILLLSHWDSRPFADNDPDKANHHKAILGVNDGASGVGVLLEIARLISIQKPNVGIDILFVDAEDLGAPYFYKGQTSEDDWCLGSQYWAENPHKAGYKANFGILLDMVGAGDATFYKDQISVKYASAVADKVWAKAQELGYGQYFRSGPGGAITDDHVYINGLANIPCIDIIHYNPQSAQGFPAHWHTLDDTMKNIDKNTLKAVGQTVTEIIFEK